VITADVAVVGGGITGASIAFHLAARGLRVVVCDSQAGAGPGGATRYSAAQVRIHHSDPFDARLAASSLPVFESWADAVGGDCGYRRTGFAFLARANHRATVAAVAGLVAGLGVETTLATPEEYAAEHPGLALDGVGVVAYEPRGGYADPIRATHSLLARARDHGARVLAGQPVTALRRRGGRLTGLCTASADISAGCVVVAAGVRSRELLAGAGILLPTRTKHIGFALAEGPALAGGGPLNVTIDDTIGMYFRPHEAGRVLFGVPLDQWDLAPSEPLSGPGADRVSLARHRLARRLPGLAGASVCATASALDAYTPDSHAIIGGVPGLDGAYVATGFSGGGFKVAPAVGRAVADELASGRPRPELEPYRLERFRMGQRILPAYDYQHL
jgi:sarcosine oxidase subunit beta